MNCRNWIIDRYSPSRKKKKLESIDAISGTWAQIIADALPTKVWSVENLRKCPGKILVRIADYSEQDGCDIRLDYYCGTCYAHVDDSRLPTLDDESLGQFLQRYVDGID